MRNQCDVLGNPLREQDVVFVSENNTLIKGTIVNIKNKYYNKTISELHIVSDTGKVIKCNKNCILAK